MKLQLAHEELCRGPLLGEKKTLASLKTYLCANLEHYEISNQLGVLLPQVEIKKEKWSLPEKIVELLE